MSIRGIGTRTVVVGLGVLASLALMAAPSWAAEGGNSANAKLCQPGGYPGALLAQDGSAFKNVGECTSDAAKGGQLVGVNATGERVEIAPFGPFLQVTCTGFGLKPSAFFGFDGCGAVSMNGTVVIHLGTVAADGTMSVSGVESCSSSHEIAYLLVQAQTAEGTLFRRTFPPPSGC